MRIQMMDVSAGKAAAAGISAASGAGSALASITEAVGAVFGVPLVVLLTAVAGAFGALAWTPPANSALRAVVTSSICALGSAWTAPLAGYIAGVPAQFTPGVAFALAAAAQITLPLAFRDGPRWIGEAVQRLIGRIGGGGGGNA